MINKLHNITITHILITVCVFIALFALPMLALAQGEVGPGAGIQAPNNAIEGMVYSLGVTIGGGALWLGGGLLDIAVTKLVVGMGEQLRGSLGTQVDALWVLVRDFFNILFIFGLIYIGFRTILFSEDSSVKRTLGMLIIAALMINFSLFITKVVVDVTNVTALQLYGAVSSGGKLTSDGLTVTRNHAVDTEDSVSARFMDEFLLTTYAQSELVREVSTKPSSQFTGQFLVYGLLMMAVMLIAGFVFAAGAFLMISRFIGLLVFMVFSPAMFLGFIFPTFQRYQSLWWNMFLKYAFVAPAYLFMLYLSLRIIEGMGIKETGGSFAKAFQANSAADGSFAIFLNFFVIAGLLVMSLTVAQSMGTYGASASMGMLKAAGRGVRGVAGATTFGLAAWGGRTLIGRKAQKLSEGDNRLARVANKNNAHGKLNSWIARRELGALRGVADSSFDARRIGGAGKSLGIGEGHKGGYTTSLKESAKRETEYAESLGHNKKAVQAIKEGNEGLIEALKTEIHDKEKEVNTNETISNARKDIKLLGTQLNAAVSLIDKERLAKAIEGQETTIENEIKIIGLDVSKDKLAKLESTQKDQISEIEKERARSYAKNLGEAPIAFDSGGIKFGHQNTSDAGAILKKINKGKDDEILEKLDKLAENTEKNEKEAA
jgi:hypothetical protein